MDLAAIPWHSLAPFILAGFFAELVDSALGLAFGFLSNALLMILGLSPVAASATTHLVKSFTSGASGLCHVTQRNVDWPLFTRLAIPGIMGGVLGVWLLTFIKVDLARPLVLVYMAAIGIYLIWRGPRRPQTYRQMRFVGFLGFIGGFLDASGGGGWGPVVTSNLLAQGMTPRMAIGTVNAAEFFVAVTVLGAFIGSLGAEAFTIAASGLLAGGSIAAPLGAYLTRRVPPKLLMQLIGSVLIVVSVIGLASLMLKPLPPLPYF